MAWYKKTKMRCLPGDVSKEIKIAMLEGKAPIEVFPWQTISMKAAKRYKKDHARKANRRLRKEKYE